MFNVSYALAFWYFCVTYFVCHQRHTNYILWHTLYLKQNTHFRSVLIDHSVKIRLDEFSSKRIIEWIKILYLSTKINRLRCQLSTERNNPNFCYAKTYFIFDKVKLISYKFYLEITVFLSFFYHNLKFKDNFKILRTTLTQYFYF